MPVRLLSDAQRERLSRFPDDVSAEELRRHFTLSEPELSVVRKLRGASNRLGFALQLCALRLMGFAPDDLQSAPARVVAFLARQLDASPGDLAFYAEREQTRTDHAAQAMRALGFREASEFERSELQAWLLQRALEHDRPSLLFELAAERLRAGRIAPPGVTQLERLVAAVRAETIAETYQRLEHLLDLERRATLDRMLEDDPALGRSRLAWLRGRAVAITPRAILVELEKLAFLRALGAEGWDVSPLSPNRVKFLAQLARRSPVQALARMSEQRRYPLLLCFGAQAVVEITDELVDLFDRCLQAAYGRARRELDELRRSEARSTNEKVRLLVELGRILLDPDADPARKLQLVDERIGPERLRAAVADAERIARPRTITTSICSPPATATCASSPRRSWPRWTSEQGPPRSRWLTQSGYCVSSTPPGRARCLRELSLTSCQLGGGPMCWPATARSIAATGSCAC